MSQLMSRSLPLSHPSAAGSIWTTSGSRPSHSRHQQDRHHLVEVLDSHPLPGNWKAQHGPRQKQKPTAESARPPLFQVETPLSQLYQTAQQKQRQPQPTTPRHHQHQPQAASPRSPRRGTGQSQATSRPASTPTCHPSPTPSPRTSSPSSAASTRACAPPRRATPTTTPATSSGS